MISFVSISTPTCNSFSSGYFTQKENLLNIILLLTDIHGRRSILKNKCAEMIMLWMLLCPDIKKYPMFVSHQMPATCYNWCLRGFQYWCYFHIRYLCFQAHVDPHTSSISESQKSDTFIGNVLNSTGCFSFVLVNIHLPKHICSWV
jgi:hypothetical protein